MENLRLLIIEDEVLIAEDLKDSVLSFGVKHIDMAHSEQIALEKIAKFKPDIVLLDIRLNGENSGLKIAEDVLVKLKTPFIFITSHSDISMVKEIVKTNPNGYITKPFKLSDLYATLSIVASKIINNQKSVIIQDGYNKHLILVSDIDYITSNGNYIDIVCGRKKITTRMTLDSILKIIDDSYFLRVSKSCIVNATKVKNFDTKGLTIGDQNIAISKVYCSDLEEKLGNL